jgi:peptide/nickel transport system permease protein
MDWTELTFQRILAGNTAVYVYPLCLLLVFLVLAAQYESFRLPLAIILIVPMCLLFAITGVWLFAVILGVLPTSGVDNGILSWILPIATLMIRPLGVLTQVVRGAMVCALSAPYVRLARSKGASDFRVVTHHALRNAAAPALTVAGDLAVGLINGAVVVEAIFGWPGIGKLMIDAILQRDFAVLQAAVLLTAVSIFVLNIFIDACYALLDARVREPARV